MILWLIVLQLLGPLGLEELERATAEPRPIGVIHLSKLFLDRVPLPLVVLLFVVALLGADA